MSAEPRDVMIDNFWHQLGKIEALLERLIVVAKEMEDQEEINTAMTIRQLKYARDKVALAKAKYQRDVMPQPIDQTERDLS